MTQLLATILFFIVFIEAGIALGWYLISVIARALREQQKRK